MGRLRATDKLIPPLELGFRVAQMGGWNNVAILTSTSPSQAVDFRWAVLHDDDSGEQYLNAYAKSPPEAWLVYGLRPRPPGVGREWLPIDYFDEEDAHAEP